jgi:carboxymethylenebutenolidase
MDKDYVSLKVDDGTDMQVFVARPSEAPKAGVIVMQEAFGVNDYIKRVATKFAEQGYLAIAPELFHRTNPGYSVVEAPWEELTPIYSAVTVEGIEADARAAHAWLIEQVGENVGIIGFCMGGRAAYIANSILPFKAAISLYGGGIAPDLLDRVSNLSAPMLFFWGGADPRLTRDVWSQIPAALDAAGKTHVQVEMSGAPHAYLTDDRSSYHKEAAELTWPLMLAFFKQRLG